MTDVEVTVVGVGFRLKKDVRAVLAQSLRNSAQSVDVVREPDNKYHENALKVFGMEGELDGRHVGYLGREVADELAPKIDSGDWAIVGATLTELYGPEFKEGAVTLHLEDMR